VRLGEVSRARQSGGFLGNGGDLGQRLAQGGVIGILGRRVGLPLGGNGAPFRPERCQRRIGGSLILLIGLIQGGAIVGIGRGDAGFGIPVGAGKGGLAGRPRTATQARRVVRNMAALRLKLY
jgi:hypothetical protein